MTKNVCWGSITGMGYFLFILAAKGIVVLTAYLDPGSGSVIATFIVGGLASLGVIYRSFRAKMSSVFSRGGSDSSETVETETADVES